MPTIRDVAARAGVAPATVSNVLTGGRPVSAMRRQKVLDAVAALGFRRNQLAASLRRRRSHTVGVAIPSLGNPFFATLVHHIEELAAQRGYQILLIDSGESEEQETARLAALLARDIDGLILVPAQDAARSLDRHAAYLPPTVLLDRGFGRAGFDTVAADNEAATEAACRHLLALGFRDIALVLSTTSLLNMRERAEGYCAALRQAGLAARAMVVDGGLDIETCRAAVEQELRRPDRPGAILAATCDATLGAVKAIRGLKLDFPGEISLIGFDDADWMTVLQPNLSVVVQPVRQMAEAAWHMLDARLSGTAPAEPARVRLPCTLRARESVRPPKPVLQWRTHSLA